MERKEEKSREVRRREGEGMHAEFGGRLEIEEAERKDRRMENGRYGIRDSMG